MKLIFLFFYFCQAQDQEMFEQMKTIDKIIFPNDNLKKSLIISSLDQNIGKQAQLLNSQESYLMKWDITIKKDENQYILNSCYGKIDKKSGEFIKSQFNNDIIRTLYESEEFVQSVSRFYFTYIEKLQNFQLATVKNNNTLQIELTYQNKKTIYVLQAQLEQDSTELVTQFSNLQTFNFTKLITAEIIQFFKINMLNQKKSGQQK